jgi:hypothetical protein
LASPMLEPSRRHGQRTLITLWPLFIAESVRRYPKPSTEIQTRMAVKTTRRAGAHCVVNAKLTSN